MKNSISLFVALLFFFTICEAQVIEIHSVTTNRQASGDVGYTLDGIRMVNHATPKIQNPDLFGDGIYPKYTNLTHGYGVTGDLEAIATIENIDIFYFGTFNKLEPTLNQFTTGEIDSLYAWSKKGGKMLIGGSASYLDFNYDPSTLNARWGFGIEAAPPTQQIIPTAEGLNSVIFEGPFGSVPSANEGGLAQGYFSSIPDGAVVLGVDTAGHPTLILDCNTLDLIISDNDAFTDLGGISQGYELQNDNDIFWVNTIAYMDQLQGPPNVTQNGDVLSAGSYLGYQWMLNGQPIGGATDSTYTATEEGNYSVAVSMSCGCVVTSEEHFVTLTGVENIPKMYQIQCFPNPVGEHLTLEFNLSESTSMKVNVYNSYGQLVPSASQLLHLPEGNRAINLDVAELPSGFYEAVLVTDGGSRAIKFVK